MRDQEFGTFAKISEPAAECFRSFNVSCGSARVILNFTLAECAGESCKPYLHAAFFWLAPAAFGGAPPKRFSAHSATWRFSFVFSKEFAKPPTPSARKNVRGLSASFFSAH